ncbi:MAG: hypothetical protein ACI9VN_001611, partial [Patescibacteria group bacterium]
MTNGTTKSALLILLMALPFATFAQSGGGEGSNYLLIALFLIAA